MWAEGWREIKDPDKDPGSGVERNVSLSSILRNSTAASQPSHQGSTCVWPTSSGLVGKALKTKNP